MPFFKKAGGQIFGCQLNKKEQAALEKEALAELAALDVKNTREIDAMILWFMHEEFGFGPKRLKRIYAGLASKMKQLVSRYEMGTADTVFLCTSKLTDYGVNLEEWEKEITDSVAD